MHIYESIIDALAGGEKEKTLELVREAIKQGLDAADILSRGLSKGLELVGDKFESLELYLPDMLLAAEVMQEAVALLEPHFGKSSTQDSGKTVVIGTVQGDMHDIGKNIVSIFLSISGFTVHDIGIDVPVPKFIEEAEEKSANIIAISALMTTTMSYMQDVIGELELKGLRDKYKVIVGGGSVTPEFAHKIGADGYGENFLEAVKESRRLTGPEA